MKMLRAVLAALIALLVNSANAQEKSYTQKLNGLETTSKELTKNSFTDNSSIGQSGNMTTAIPLVMVSSRTMKFPLQLQYAAGIKVGQTSGPVGLGWVLPVGSIVRDYGSFEPDYTSTSSEAEMKASWQAGIDGWLTSEGGSTVDPGTHNQYLGYDAVDSENTPVGLSDQYHVNVAGMLSNTFWNGSEADATSFEWNFNSFTRSKVNYTVRTFKISQEFTRINELNNILCQNCNDKGYFHPDGSFAAAIGVYPYVRNGEFHLPGSANPIGDERFVKYEDFESFSITDENGVTYVFGRPLRGQKYVFSDDPYWSATDATGQTSPANGNFWKVDYIAEWLLTEIHSVDYIDANGNGVADDADSGDWIRFEYTKPTKQVATVWTGIGSRMNQEVPMYREWSNFSQTDQASSLMREQAYLTKIVTPTQYLDLTISQRFEVDHDYYSKPANKIASEYYYEDRHFSTSGGGSNTDFDIEYPVETMKYDTLRLYSKLIDKRVYPNENMLMQGVVLQYAEKGSEDELAVSSFLILDNEGNDKSVDKPSEPQNFDISNYDDGITKRGKTTLLKVEYLDSEMNPDTKTAYEFEYAYNPSYDELHKREIVRRYFFPSVRSSDYTNPDERYLVPFGYTEKILEDSGISYTSQAGTVAPSEFLIDYPYEERYYKYQASAQEVNDMVQNGQDLPANQPVFSQEIDHQLTPISDVYGFLYAENCEECPKAWSLTKITSPTGATINFEYEQSAYEKGTDELGWSFGENKIPIVEQYNELAKNRSLRQDVFNRYAENNMSNPNLVPKTLTATFEVPLPELYGIRLKSKTISDRANPPVEISYSYSAGHFTSLPAEYVTNYLVGFRHFVKREDWRHHWEILAYPFQMIQSLPTWQNDFREKMRTAAITGIEIDSYQSTFFYDDVTMEEYGGAKTRFHYGPLTGDSEDTYLQYGMFCSRMPSASIDGRFIIGPLSTFRGNIAMTKKELFENGNSQAIQTESYIYEVAIVEEKKIQFNYALALPPYPATVYPHNNVGDPVSVHLNDEIVLWDNVFEYWLPIEGSTTINSYPVSTGPIAAGVNSWTTVGSTTPNQPSLVFVKDHIYAYSFTLTPPGDNAFVQWRTTRITLKEERKDYKGMLSTTTYVYDTDDFDLQTKTVQTINEPEKYITVYHYAHDSYDGITTKFTDLNIYSVSTGTTTYLNDVQPANTVSANRLTYNYLLTIPKLQNTWQYETANLDQVTGTFTPGTFDFAQIAHPGWRKREVEIFEYNPDGNMLSTRKNQLFSKAVSGHERALNKGNIQYPGSRFDGTYSGFEDLVSGNLIFDNWSEESYKAERWFSKEEEFIEEQGFSYIQAANPCGYDLPDVDVRQFSKYYNIVSIDNVNNLNVGDEVKVELTAGQYASPSNYSFTIETTISKIIDGSLFPAEGNGNITNNAKDYIACFSDPIIFPASTFNMNVIVNGYEVQTDENAALTISETKITAKRPVYHPSSTYARTGKYSYRLQTIRTENDEAKQTPIRPVRIYPTSEACAEPEEPGDAVMKSSENSSLPAECFIEYEASVWLKYDYDVKQAPVEGTVVPKTLDIQGDAIYRNGEVHDIDNHKGVLIVCDVWNSDRTQLIDQLIFYPDDLTSSWTKFTVNLSILRSDKWLEVYIVNEKEQLSVPFGQRKSVFVDDILVYPSGAKYSYNCFNTFGYPTFEVDNNDVFSQQTYDEKNRPLAGFNVYGQMISQLEYFEHPDWINSYNHITERLWVDNNKYNEKRMYLDGQGKTRQVIVSDPDRNSRLVTETDIYNERGKLHLSYKPYYLPGYALPQKPDNQYATKTMDLYGTGLTATALIYEDRPDEVLASVTQPYLSTENEVIATQSDYVSTITINNLYSSKSYNVGQLIVHELVNELGNKVRTYMDNYGRVIMEEHETGTGHSQQSNGTITFNAGSSQFARTWFVYDSAGHLIQVVDPNGKTTHYYYNSLGLVIKSDSPDKGISEMRYDKFDQVRFIKTENDLQAETDGGSGAKQFKYLKYDEWGRVTEQGIVVSPAAGTYTPGGTLPFPTTDYFNDYTYIDDPDFPSDEKLVELHVRLSYDGSREQFNSHALIEERVYSGHQLDANFYCLSATTDIKSYSYMADGQVAEINYTYTGLSGTHTMRQLYNNMHLPVGKEYLHPSNGFYNFAWHQELDNFGRNVRNYTTTGNLDVESSRNYYDATGNLLMTGIGATGISTDPHLDYHINHLNIRNELIEQQSKDFRFGLKYDAAGNIKDQYWSNEHFDPTFNPANVNVNHYAYSYDKMNRLVGADYRQSKLTEDPFANFGDLGTSVPSDFNCTVVTSEVDSYLAPTFQTFSDNIRNGVDVAISTDALNALNQLQVNYERYNEPYALLDSLERDSLINRYLGDCNKTGLKPYSYEYYMATENGDAAHKDLLNATPDPTASVMKYTKLLLEGMPYNPGTSCSPNPESTVYSYLDGFPFPASENNITPYDCAYWYSDNGNLTSLNRTDDVGVRQTQDYSYSDPDNNQLSEVFFDVPVNQTYTYNYDSEGNLTDDARNGVTDIDYSDFNSMPQAITNGNGTRSYRYDSKQDRIVKEVAANDREYYLDGVVIDQNGNVKSYATAAGYAVPDAQNAQFHYFYYVTDWLGTTRGVMDENGTMLNAADHYPFGMRMPGRAFVTDAEGNRYQFTGHEFDAETGYGYHGARYYNRELGRYIGVDPLTQKYQSWTSYNYTMDNPVAMIDPGGKAPTDWVLQENGTVYWDKNANDQASTKEDETYLGKTLTFEFNSYIDKDLWDGPTLGGIVDPAGDKLTSTIELTGNENENGEFVSMSAKMRTRPGVTPIGTARDFYPGEGGNIHVFTLEGTGTGISLNFEQHASVSPSEEFLLNAAGYKIVDVAQKLRIEYQSSTGKLLISVYTNVFPSATLEMNDRIIMQYYQPSFKATHIAPIIGSTPTPRGRMPIIDYSYYPSIFFKRN